MWKQKLGISIGNNYKIPTEEIVKIVKKAGYDAISPEYAADVDITPIIETALENGLAIQSIHAPFTGAANLWSDEKDVYLPALDDILNAVEFCEKAKVPTLVVHTWIGFDKNESHVTEAGFKNFETIVNTAKKSGVTIAFENTEGEDTLFALMEHFKNEENVGFCWDSGHEMCYNHSKDLLALFGDRLMMTHLNDNLGISRFDGEIFWTDDLHLLPYDGVADWDYNIERLKKSNRLEFLNFELNITSKPDRHENDIYTKMLYEEYFAESYKRACKIAYKLSR